MSDNTVFAQLGVDLGMTNVDATAHAMGITAPLFGYPSEAIGGLQDRRLTAADGRRLRDAGQRRRSHIHRRSSPRSCNRTARTINLGNPAKTRSSATGEAYAADPGAQDRGDQRHRDRSQLRLSGGRQDRHDQQLHRRVVRRLHARAVDRRLGRLSERDHLHDRRQRPRPRIRRHAGGTDLARLTWRQASDGYCEDFAEPSDTWEGVLVPRRRTP